MMVSNPDWDEDAVAVFADFKSVVANSMGRVEGKARSLGGT